MNLRDYQARAVDFLVPRKRAFIEAPAGSGKTVIGCTAVARVLEADPALRVLWLANTVDQVRQAIETFDAVWAASSNIRFSCVASRVQSFEYDLVVLDEAHHMPAATWSAVVANMRPGATLWGLSATPFGDDEERNQLVRDTFKAFCVVGRDAVAASGHLVPAKVIFHDLDAFHEFDQVIEAKVTERVAKQHRKWPFIAIDELAKRARWFFTREAIEGHGRRNWAIAALASSAVRAGESVLILVASIEHGRVLKDMLGEAFPVALVYAAVGKKKRQSMIEGFQKGTIPCMIATSLADEGLDVPRASTLILALAGRSSTKLVQRVGRVLRPFEGKTHGAIHDFLDKGSIYGYAQARKRRAFYDGLGFSILDGPQWENSL